MRKLSLGVVLTVVVAWSSPKALGQEAAVRNSGNRVLIPQSNVERPEDIGVKAHTHLRLILPPGRPLTAVAGPAELPPVLGLFFETPASIACVYSLVRNPLPGCDPDLTTQNPSGNQGGGAIALVDAFDDPTAAADLATFSAQFGLPAADFKVVYVNGEKPAVDPTGDSELEESLDIEWAHAMSPQAKIYLVEAASLDFSDLFAGAQLASRLVAEAGGGEVSMSFGGGEDPSETSFDSIFTTPGVVYFASAGDSPGPEYPSVSPNVVSAGGTTISRNALTGVFLFENTWQDAGGGASFFEPRPAFQNGLGRIVGPTRGTPDLSFDANPNTGVWIFDGNNFEGQPVGWAVVGGTSVSAPSLAGIINSAGTFHNSSQAENRELYEHLSNPTTFRDILSGNCGFNIGSFAAPGWDFCTGVGTPSGYQGK
jgi:kumamolisin